MSRRATVEFAKMVAFAVLGIAIVCYAIFASRDYIRGPLIIIDEPRNNSMVSSSTVHVKGRAVRVKNLTMNDRDITMDEQGNFTEILLIYPGQNSISFRAEDKFKHKTLEVLTIVGSGFEMLKTKAVPAAIRSSTTPHMASTTASTTPFSSSTDSQIDSSDN